MAWYVFKHRDKFTFTLPKWTVLFPTFPGLFILLPALFVITFWTSPFCIKLVRSERLLTINVSLTNNKAAACRSLYHVLDNVGFVCTTKKTFRRPSSYEAPVYTRDKAVPEELASAAKRQPVPQPGWEERARCENRTHVHTGMANQPSD
jgi:hypothetical protein